MVLVPRGREVVTQVLDASLRVLPEAPAPIEQAARVRVHHGTAEVLARVRLPAGAPLEPGRTGAVQLRLERPVCALPGDRFIVRRYSPITTIGGGEIVDVDPPRWKRSDPRWPRRVERLVGGDASARLVDLARRAGRGGVSLKQVAVRLGTTPDAARAELPADLLVLGEDRVLERAAAEELIDALGRALDEHHQRLPLESGVPMAELARRWCPAWSGSAYEELLRRAAAAGSLVVDRETVRRPNHDPRPAGAEAEALQGLVDELEGRGLATVSTEELAEATRIPRERVGKLLSAAARDGTIVRVKDGLWLSGAAWERLVEGLAQRAGRGEWTLDVRAFKDLFGLSRKHAIPLLERLDDAGITRRAGNERRIQPAVMDAGRET
jgi:selenocysteine-specific elongation factor